MQPKYYAPPQLPLGGDPPPKKSRVNLFIGIAIGVVVTITAVMVFGWYMVNRSVDDLKGSAVGASTSTGTDGAGAAKIDIDSATPEQFYDDRYFTDAQRVAWAWNQLSQPATEGGGLSRIQSANQQLRERNPLADGVNVEPSIGMSANEILINESSTYFYAASTHDLSDADRAKVLAAVIDNSSDSLQIVERNVLERDLRNVSGIEEVDTSSVNNLPVESPIFKRTVLKNGFDPKGIETKVMNVHLKNTTDGKKQKYYQFIDGKPVQVYQCDSTDATLRASNPQNIPAF